MSNSSFVGARDILAHNFAASWPTTVNWLEKNDHKHASLDTLSAYEVFPPEDATLLPSAPWSSILMFYEGQKLNLAVSADALGHTRLECA